MLYVLVVVVTTWTGTYNFETQKTFADTGQCLEYAKDVKTMLSEQLFVAEAKMQCEARSNGRRRESKPDAVSKTLFGDQLLRTDVTYSKKKRSAVSSSKPRRSKKRRSKRHYDRPAIERPIAVAKGPLTFWGWLFPSSNQQ